MGVRVRQHGEWGIIIGKCILGLYYDLEKSVREGGGGRGEGIILYYVFQI